MLSERGANSVAMAGSGCAPVLTIDHYSEGILDVQHFRRKYLLSENDETMFNDALRTLLTCKNISLV